MALDYFVKLFRHLLFNSPFNMFNASPPRAELKYTDHNIIRPKTQDTSWVKS